MLYDPFPDHKILVTHVCLKVLNVPLVSVASSVNLVVFVAVLSTSSLRIKASMIFILSLTFADFLIAVIDVPLIIAVVEQVRQDPLLHSRVESACVFYVNWIMCGASLHQLDHVWCIFYINWITCGASSFSLLAASFDRLVFVRFPFKYEEISTAKRACICVLLIWVCSIIIFYLAWLNNGNIFAYHLFVLVLLFVVCYASVHFHIISVVRSLITPISVSMSCGELQTANRGELQTAKADDKVVRQHRQHSFSL